MYDANITVEVLSRFGISSTREDAVALTKLLVREGQSPADDYFSSKFPQQIVLFGEEPAGFYIKPRNLVINWRDVMGTTLPNAVFASVSAVQLPWLTPFAVLAIIWDTHCKMVVPLKAEQAIVLRSIWECGAHASEAQILEMITKHEWLNMQSKPPFDLTASLDKLATAGLIEIVDGTARLIDNIVFEAD
ncbi:hypothetical protein PMI07_002361 [Rhizobium sp. CF080]|uniref:hypothetical protein n=1 Tax=Rhizobium sp. (strain CF080) TaxID=1144310 RepID=UPI000271780F|nr:hypothetical protein [Rhizobium sp. CF080]EUB95873.1 hypothetical protein PMI07_002361 [Rhizobium sp. CF080]